MTQRRKASEIRPFGMRDKIGYLFGDFGNDFTFILSSSFLLKFSTDIFLDSYKNENKAIKFAEKKVKEVNEMIEVLSSTFENK